MPPLFLPLSSKGEASLVYFTTHSWNVLGMVFSAIAAFDIRNDPGSQISVCWDVVPSSTLQAVFTHEPSSFELLRPSKSCVSSAVGLQKA